MNKGNIFSRKTVYNSLQTDIRKNGKQEITKNLPTEVKQIIEEKPKAISQIIEIEPEKPKSPKLSMKILETRIESLQEKLKTKNEDDKSFDNFKELLEKVMY